ncbi:hypothetical protein [Morganella morganii]|uniref:hypothetical protein n=1 Tax=Morganella morganii TaxID=582 RepID=UPI00388FEB91
MTDKELPPIYSKDYSHDIASLRDMFATEAMNGLLANHQSTPLGASFKPDSLAEAAYRMADAMLRAREK